MNNKLPPETLAAIKPLEQSLFIAVRTGAAEEAVELATRIQAIFGADRRHPRLLRAKLWAFQACLDAQRLEYAERGLIGVRQLSRPTTRLHLEASSLLAVCYLRQKKIDDAKKLIRAVIKNINNIDSQRTRHQFQKRLIERVEEECILVELIGKGDTTSMDAKEIHSKAILLVQRGSNDEIFRLIGNAIPVAGTQLLADVRDYSIKQLPAPDQKLLPPPAKSAESKHIGKATFSALKRITWKTICDPESTIYKLWSKKIPEVFNEGYFAAALVSAMSSFRIGLPLLASGAAALFMKYSAKEICELSKPKGIMIDRTETDD